MARVRREDAGARAAGRVGTPLFATALLVFLGTLLWTGRGADVERDVLIPFDLLLVVVLGLLLYSVSARDPQRPPNAFGVLQVVLVVSALAADAVARWAIGARGKRTLRFAMTHAGHVRPRPCRPLNQ